MGDSIGNTFKRLADMSEFCGIVGGDHRKILTKEKVYFGDLQFHGDDLITILYYGDDNAELKQISVSTPLLSLLTFQLEEYLPWYHPEDFAEWVESTRGVLEKALELVNNAKCECNKT